MSSPAFKEQDLDENWMASPEFRASQPTTSQPGTVQQMTGRPSLRLGRIDPAAIARAEAALRGLASQFGQWLQTEVEKLQAARAAIRTEGLTRATADRLYTHAHDLKGLGTTYEFPIITRIAGSLCKLLGDGERRVGTPLWLLDAHVDAIVACLRDDTRDVDTPTGCARVEQLERDVSVCLGG